MRSMTISYDRKCQEEFAALYPRMRHYFVSIDIDCPYGLPHTATFHQATFGPISERAMELFLAAGYRRNGNCLYNMHCASCGACLPIRLLPDQFRPNRNQKRSLQRNRDISVSLQPLSMTGENIVLCEKFLRARYPKENNTARGYFRDFFVNNIVSTAQLQLRLNGRLVGTSVIDIGYNWLNAVYFFFDPEEEKRSLGTLNIMHLVELCREWDIEYLYLGYLIRQVRAMSYKSAFRPYQLLLDDEWRTIDRPTDPGK